MFEIPELLQAICRVGELRRHDIYQFIQVCRFWHDAAISILWENLSSLVPLLCLLPEDAWQLEPRKLRLGRSMQAFVLRRLLSEADWEKVLRHSCFVRYLTVREHMDKRVLSEQTLWLLLQTPPPSDVFPHLQCLRFEVAFPTTHDKTLLAMLLSPTTTSLTVSSTDDTLICDYEPIARRCSDIRTLIVNESYEDENVAPISSFDIANAVSKWSGLQTISLRTGPWHPSLVMQLVRLRSLSELTLWIHEDGDENPSAGEPVSIDEPAASSFASLRKLTLGGAPVCCVVSFLELLDGSPIEAISLAPVLLKHSLENFQRVLNLARDHCSADTMRSLQIYFDREDDDGHWIQTPLQMQSIRVLSRFRNLEVLCLQATLGVDLSDDDYAEAVGWWPKLTSFNVDTRSLALVAGPVPGTPATPQTLIHFARSCPSLQTLELPLDVTDVPPVDLELYRMRSRNHPLRYLFVGDSPISETDSIALLLSRIFPALEPYDLAYDDGTEWSEGWPDVCESLRLLARVQALEDADRSTMEVD
ncbi:hypothetical protein EV714DRAFT_274853 [Schizophyllum commune]